MVNLKERSLPPLWLVGTVASIFLLQVAVTLARPVSTYRLLALGADGTTLGLTAACFAVPPMLLAISFGRWAERHHYFGGVSLVGRHGLAGDSRRSGDALRLT